MYANEASQTVASDQQAVAENHLPFIGRGIKAGANRETIIGRLVQKGVSREAAEEMVDSFTDAESTLNAAEKAAMGTPGRAAVGGLIAALVGGALWGMLVKATGYEIGYAAWALGLLCGVGVLLASGGRRGPACQLVAVGSALFSVVFGKFVAFRLMLADEAQKEYGRELGDVLPLLSFDSARFFFDALPEMISPFDAVWIFLAIATAWKMTRNPA
ncbi:MAG: hypothetical protein HYV63_14030 [Candidatus Schekmanbacteria bacterium]|nr:hypothetical protein [Candidatus Schekmanbacteria bacterium]